MESSAVKTVESDLRKPRRWPDAVEAAAIRLVAHAALADHDDIVRQEVVNEYLTGLRVEHVRPLFAAMLNCVAMAEYHAADPAAKLDKIRWTLGRALIDALIPAASDLVNGCNPRIAEAAGIDVATDEVDA